MAAAGESGPASLVLDTISDGWITDLDRLRDLEGHADDPAFRAAYAEAKLAAKRRSDWVGEHPDELDSSSLFDVRWKRIHEYKQQLLNLLHICWLYRRLKEDPTYLRSRGSSFSPEGGGYGRRRTSSRRSTPWRTW